MDLLRNHCNLILCLSGLWWKSWSCSWWRLNSRKLCSPSSSIMRSDFSYFLYGIPKHRSGVRGMLWVVTCWRGSGSADPYLWLMDPDPTPDPAPFFSDFKDERKLIFSTFFPLTHSQAHSLSSVLKTKCLPKFCANILLCKHYFSPLNTFLRKGRIRIPEPYLWLMDPDPGGPKICGSGFGSGSPTVTLLRSEGCYSRFKCCFFQNYCS